ncbi:MAG: TetR/AcrR family transcriptional regulator [Candidatus Omnitrophica bacterium]|nr:TetR/AcrR family transcriptional regulator [Candidatus Omnitrophota bacterium]
MRRLDENKRKHIGEAAIKLMVTVGFVHTSMHRIAKEARVAASTIYLYYANKDDMLNKVYLMVKRDFSDALLQGFDAQMPIQEGIRVIFDTICSYFEEKPLHASFMEQFENSALVKKEIRDQAMAYYRPFFRLVERGVQEQILKPMPATTIGAFIFYPVVGMIRRGLSEGIRLTRGEKDKIFGMVWGAVQA